MPKISEGIHHFLRAQMPKHNGPDLLQAWTFALETQVNVAAGNGEPIAGKRTTWTDGVNEWFNIRIPRNAFSDPHFKDYELSFPLDLHVEGIGCTGWDWVNRCSRWVGFDFDSLTAHAVGVGISAEDLAAVRDAAKKLPYVQVRRSTGGAGLHLYVYFGEAGVPTANHTEHAALARCVLGMMSSETGFDFASQIDCCGSVLWIWHRKMTEENRGLELIKPHDKGITVADLPVNWKDHIEVVTRRRSKVRVSGIKDENLDPFDALASARKLVPLDASHKALIEGLMRSGFTTIWVPDHHLLQTHTKALQNLMDNPEARKELGLVGVFKTASEGNDPGNPNCFLFPLVGGVWKVYRFSPGIHEVGTWEQDGEGWTTCYFNRSPDLSIAARAMGGAEMANNGGFLFDSAAEAQQVVAALGEKLDLPEDLLSCQTQLKKNKDGRLVVSLKQDHRGIRPDKGWIAKRGGWWEKVFNLPTGPKQQRNDELGFSQYDNIFRTLVSPAGERAGWVTRDQSGDWVRMPKDDVRSALLSMDIPKADTDILLGTAVLRPWKIVHLPFHPEYPGGRQWNLGAAQFRYQPVPPDEDDETSPHPHWDKILQHCFCDLDDTIRNEPWAKQANIRTGAQYGLAWIACLLREPFEPLPYLFLFGPEDSGKSIIHEAIEILTTGGVVRADRALTNSNDFNGELANAVLAVVEEVNVAASPLAHNRIKDWVTSRTLWIRKMRTDAYSQPNTLHFIQCANEQSYCPVFPGDTRITVLYVPTIAKEDKIAKQDLLARLAKEAPYFMDTVMNMQLPPVQGRLRLPVVASHSKHQSEELNRDPLERFILDNCHRVPGSKILFSEFFERFSQWLAKEGWPAWTKFKVSKRLPTDCPSGAGTGNKRYIGNLSWEPALDGQDRKPYIFIDGRLLIKEEYCEAGADLQID